MLVYHRDFHSEYIFKVASAPFRSSFGIYKHDRIITWWPPAAVYREFIILKIWVLEIQKCLNMILGLAAFISTGFQSNSMVKGLCVPCSTKRTRRMKRHRHSWKRLQRRRVMMMTSPRRDQELRRDLDLRDRVQPRHRLNLYV